MIFIPIAKLTNNTDKSFFVEQVQLYTKLVNTYCLKNNIENNSDDSNINIDELKLIGVIEKEEDIKLLKALLKEDFIPFIKSVNFAVANKNQMNGLLDKLYNSKRAELQKDFDNKKQFTLVDFFCGAGGLSLCRRRF